MRPNSSILLISLFTITLTISTGLRAQDQKAQDEKAQDEKARQTTEIALRDFTASNPLRGAITTVAFTISDDKKTAKAQLGFTQPGGSSWLATISGPVGSDAKRVQLATEEGLNDSVTGELGWKYTLWVNVREALDLTNGCRAASGSEDCSRDALPEAKKLVYDKAAGLKVATYVFGVSGKVGRKSFDFVDATTLVSGKVSRQGSSVAMSVGKFGSSIYLTNFTYRRETSYKEGDKATICTPVGSAGSKCQDSALGAPKKKLQNLFQLEARKFVGIQAALSPRITYDSSARVWSGELPIYLRQKASDPFNGGVSLGYDTKQHKVTFVLFVGAL